MIPDELLEIVFETALSEDRYVWYSLFCLSKKWRTWLLKTQPDIAEHGHMLAHIRGYAVLHHNDRYHEFARRMELKNRTLILLWDPDHFGRTKALERTKHLIYRSLRGGDRYLFDEALMLGLIDDTLAMTLFLHLFNLSSFDMSLLVTLFHLCDDKKKDIFEYEDIYQNAERFIEFVSVVGIGVWNTDEIATLAFDYSCLLLDVQFMDRLISTIPSCKKRMTWEFDFLYFMSNYPLYDKIVWYFKKGMSSVDTFVAIELSIISKRRILSAIEDVLTQFQPLKQLHRLITTDEFVKMHVVHPVKRTPKQRPQETWINNGQPSDAEARTLMHEIKPLVTTTFHHHTYASIETSPITSSDESDYSSIDCSDEEQFTPHLSRLKRSYIKDLEDKWNSANKRARR